MTVKLYLASPELEASAQIVDLVSHPEKPLVALRLDQTVFHPQGGGQRADQGLIDDIPVLHVTHGPDGTVDHWVDATAAKARGTTVNLKVDAEYRRAQARLHTAGHLLAALIEQEYQNLKAIAGHHWPGEARVDFEILDREAPRPNLEELQTTLVAPLAAESASPVAILGDPMNDRSIAIGTHPAVPCGGTHLSSLAELPPIKITRARAKSGKLRVSYEL